MIRLRGTSSTNKSNGFAGGGGTLTCCAQALRVLLAFALTLTLSAACLTPLVLLSGCSEKPLFMEIKKSYTLELSVIGKVKKKEVVEGTAHATVRVKKDKDSEHYTAQITGITFDGNLTGNTQSVEEAPEYFYGMSPDASSKIDKLFENRPNYWVVLPPSITVFTGDEKAQGSAVRGSSSITEAADEAAQSNKDKLALPGISMTIPITALVGKEEDYAKVAIVLPDVEAQSDEDAEQVEHGAWNGIAAEAPRVYAVENGITVAPLDDSGDGRADRVIVVDYAPPAEGGLVLPVPKRIAGLQASVAEYAERRAAELSEEMDEASKASEISAIYAKIDTELAFIGEVSERAKRALIAARTSKVLLEVPMVEQFPAAPSGGEIAVLAMLLLYNDYDTSLEQCLNEMVYNNNPKYGFAGNPRDFTGHTIYPEPAGEWLKKRLGSYQILTDATQDKLCEVLLKGQPIMVWMNHPVGGLRALCLTGFDADGFYMNDPYGVKDWFCDYWSFFNAYWYQYDNMALTY
ncbi:MAG: C39 family peptidase [Coriobacteriales bacterium]|nr:C39 family peptidase [Coriobacteriales bacterium]